MSAAAAVIAIAALALAASGCGSSSEQTSTTGGSPAQSNSAPATSSSAPSGLRPRSCRAPQLDPPKIVVVGADCGEGRRVAAAWSAKAMCSPRGESSRGSCSLGKLRCLSVSTDRGLRVNCAHPGVSITFAGRRG